MLMRTNQSGQTVALFAVSLLLVAIVTFFTISTGNRLQEKVKAQAAADSAAYGLAVSQSRAMNVMALANRAIVGEYVSALSVTGQISWMNIYEWTFDMQAELWQKLKADKDAECALYQYCHSGVGHSDPSCRHREVCCKGPQGGCCTSDCDYYNCYAAACSAPDALFDKISNDWHQGFGDKSWEGIHSKWHEYPSPKIKELGRYAADYVHQAWRASDQGVAAFKTYRDLLDKQTFTKGVASTVDRRMTAATSAHGGATAPIVGAQRNLETAIEVYPATSGAGDIRDADFDVFNEILTGTRGGGQNNLDPDPMVWEPQHGIADGYFNDDAHALPPICANGAYHLGPWPTYDCEATWDQNYGSFAQVRKWNQIDDPAGNFRGGSMMLAGNADSSDDIHSANTSNLHNYTLGDPGSLGGRKALSADDRATTTASFTIEQIVCPAYPTVLPGKSLVCLSETGKRETMFSEVAHDNTLQCMRSFVIRGAGDTANPSKGYNVGDDTFNAGANCSGDTEVGFFRFAIQDDVTFTTTPFSGNTKTATSAVNLYGQPFTYAATQVDATRDENGRPLPWNFSLVRIGGSLLTLDQRKDQDGNTRTTNGDRDGTTVNGSNDGMNTDTYRYVRGFAAGLSYYHNPTGWKEVPNLFNPYWRAKLSSPGANALSSLDAISKDDCEIGKELGLRDDANAGRCQ